MKYKGILLDFYGTCVAEDDAIIERIISKIGEYSSASREEIWSSWKFNEGCAAAFGSAFRTQKEIELSTLQAVLTQFEVDLDVEDLSSGLFDYWAGPAVYPDTVGFLRRQEIPVSIVSNIDNSFLESALQLIDFQFHDIVTSEDVRAYKPRPEIYHRALERNRFRTDEVVHIGDSYSLDVIGAHGCGIDVVWVNRKGRVKPEGLMNLEVSTLSEIKWDNNSAHAIP
jgi:2-haloalkanoic acid dehalogenase type II